jgi:outer membrane protein OmpA-like peptidoglycan-associated protein
VLIGAVGSFAINSATLTANLKTQIHRLAVLTKSDHFTAESLYGYTTATGSVSSQLAISNRRANAVAAYLRSQLRSLHVAGVTVTSAGEGTFKTQTGATFRRVEIFVKG